MEIHFNRVQLKKGALVPGPCEASSVALFWPAGPPSSPASSAVSLAKTGEKQNKKEKKKKGGGTF